MYETFKGYASTVPAIYAASVKADLFSAAPRSSRAPARPRSTKTTCRSPSTTAWSRPSTILGALDDLMRFQMRRLDLADPAMYDVYARMPGEFAIDLPFDQAYALVVEALAPLGADYQATLRRATAERWIDPYENEGKSSGAYSWGTYETHPYVLMNYHETLEDLLTIAHEMGHSLHPTLARRRSPRRWRILPVRGGGSLHRQRSAGFDVPSGQAPGKGRPSYLLNNLLQAYRTTLFRQTMFAEFEKAAHEMAERGEALTGESLNALYATSTAPTTLPSIRPA
jgi:oligoendopeptidase F